MKEILNRLIHHESLSRDQARGVIIKIADGKYSPIQISSFLTIYMIRSISLEELEGFRDALLELCVAVNLKDFDTIDLCGTGGDGKDTFNISTLASFVTAGAGIKVTKHGNYGVSSSCGSSNVLEHLGVTFTNNESVLRRCLEKAGICILHAPLFHPAMKNVASIRRELGVKTFFNMLGPLVNPSFPKNQLTGVFNLELARLYQYLFQKTSQNFTVLYSLDGYDEISLTGSTKAISNQSERVLNPSDFGLSILKASEISGGNEVASSAEIFMNVLKNKATEAQQNVVCANAAMAISTIKGVSILDGFEIGKESLRSGKALQALTSLQKISSL